MRAHTTELSRRRFLGGSLLLVAGTAVAACSTNPNGGTGSSGSGVTTTLNVWFHAYGEAGTQQAALRYAAAFTKANPSIAVKVTWVPGDYSTKLNSTLLTPDAPDVFEYADAVEGFATGGQIAALDDIYGDAKSDFNQNDIDLLTVNGKLYGVKMLDDVMMLYYRKSVLSKAGINPPQSFDELVAAAKQLTTKDNKGLFVGNDGVGDMPSLAAWSNGAELIDANGKAVFDSPQAVAAISALKRLHDDKSLLLGFTTDWWDPSAFTQNVVPMQWSGLWAMPGVKAALGDDFGVLPWPAFNATGKPVVRVGGWISMVNAKGKNVDAAKKFVQWLWIQQTSLQTDFNESYGFHVPPRKSVAAAADKLKSGPAKDTVDLAGKYGRIFPTTWDSAVATGFTAAATKVVTGQGGDPAQIMAAAAKQAQGDIDKQRG